MCRDFQLAAECYSVIHAIAGLDNICLLSPTSSRYQVQTRAAIMIFPHDRLVPTLFRGYVEDRNHWIQQRQFLVETRYSELLYSRQSLLMISPRKPYATEYRYLNRCILACITHRSNRLTPLSFRFPVHSSLATNTQSLTVYLPQCLTLATNNLTIVTILL